MRQIFTILMLTGLSITLKAQLVFNENFTGYTTSALNGQGSGTWSRSGSGQDVTVATTTPLIHAGYTSGSQYITMVNSNGRTEAKDLSGSGISGSGTRFIYTSFVVRATSAGTATATGSADYSFRITDGSFSLFRFYMGKDGSNNLKFGASVGTTPFFATGTFSFGTTYLVLIRYDIGSGSSDDAVHMWVNPSLSSEPSTATATNSTSGSGETNYGTLTTLELQQNTSTAAAAFDGFKVSTATTSAAAWTNLAPAGAPLPVKLDNFDAAKDGNGSVKLVWNTSDEIGLKSYEVERSTDGFNFSSIGSVDAQNKKTYYFTDIQPSSDNNFYRLKMVDLDGNFKLSHVVSIKSKTGLNLVLSPNPVKDVLVVQHPKAETSTQLQVVNADGRMLKNIQLPANAVETTIDFSGFRSGMYYIVFKSTTATVSKAILKQ